MTSYNDPGAIGSHPNIRAKHAAAILLFDRSSSDLKVLVGKRSAKHAFMPDVYVFPGGKRDPSDHRLSFAQDLSQDTHIALAKTLGAKASLSTTRSFALAAMRELQEETGLNCWLDGPSNTRAPDLSPLRFFARAITPPGQVRRYDTRFFTAFADEVKIAGPAVRESDELHDVQWLSIGDKASVNMPAITRLVLDDAIATMTKSQQSFTQTPVVQYVVRNKQFLRSFL